MQFGTLAPTNLTSDETIALFPSLGHLEEDGRTWRIQVHGEVFTHADRISLGKRILLQLLQRAMKATPAELQSDIFRQRIQRFLAVDKGGKKIALRIGHDEHILPKKSRGNGHFQATLRITSSELSELQLAGAYDEGKLTLGACVPEGGTCFPAPVHLLPREGVSVISDIDDTLKHTQVLSRHSLLANTFLREFEPIPGMANLFREWSDQGAAFHYVSSSPWQLYRNLAGLFETEGFPEGSFHLLAFRLRDHLMRKILMMRRSGKGSVIKGILQMFPERRFILVGDSGEADPEIYANIAQKFPRQVARVFIREVAGPKNSERRFLKAFRKIPRSLATIFKDPEELEGAMEGL
ncbi:MAG: phosphatidate phosphatase App1 family protein [Pirellulaceae bacterium]